MENVLVDAKLYRLNKPKEVWHIFAPHHYLSATLMSATRAFLVIMDDEVVGFTSSCPLPSGTLTNAWREHRTVVLPDYQGMGLGTRLAEWLGEWHIAQGQRFYSRSTHPKLGLKREASNVWRGTTRNKKVRKEGWAKAKGYDTRRLAWSHEYMGREPEQVLAEDLRRTLDVETSQLLQCCSKEGKVPEETETNMTGEIVAKYTKTLAAVRKTENNVLSIGDALRIEVTGPSDSPKTYEEVSAAIKSEVGVDYTTSRLRTLRLVAESFPDTQEREAYFRRGASVRAFEICTSGAFDPKSTYGKKWPFNKRKEMLNDLLDAVDYLNDNNSEFTTKLPKKLSSALKHPREITPEVLNRLWLKNRANSSTGKWQFAMRALLEAFDMPYDTRSKKMDREDVIKAVKADPELKAKVLEDIAAGDDLKDILATKSGSTIVDNVYKAELANAKEREAAYEFEDGVNDIFEGGAKAKIKKTVQDVSSIQSLKENIWNARKNFLQALGLIAEISDIVNDEEKAEILKLAEESVDVGRALCSRLSSSSIDDELSNITQA